MVIEGVSVTVAMYCLIQFYVQLKDDLAEHSPLPKVAAIKLVIFLSFWQTILISFLTSSGAIKPSQRLQGPDLRIGIPSLLLCIEMAIFSVFHLFAFPWQVYDIRRSAIVASETVPGHPPNPRTAYLGGPLGSKALLDAFNPWDFIKAIGRGFRWFVVGRRNREQDVSYQSYKISRPLNPDASDLEGTGNTRNKISGGPFTPGAISKQGRYHQVEGGFDEDDRRLLSHQQAIPLSSSDNLYPRPGMRLPDERDLYDSSNSRSSNSKSEYQNNPRHTNHMRNPSTQNPPYPTATTGQDQTFIGIHDPNPAFYHDHHHQQEQDTSYHGAASSFPHNNMNDRISLASTTSSDPDDWRDWSGAHGPHNQSDVARLSGEHIVQARLSAEQERRSIQQQRSSRRGSEESGRSSERMRAQQQQQQRLSAIGRPSGESSRSGVSGVREEAVGGGLGVKDRERERSRGKSPSEVWRGMQRGTGIGKGSEDFD
ncbi:MAG: hypothetical protein Q9169_003773 [Polycauliona sp. 2 TL-2023]